MTVKVTTRTELRDRLRRIVMDQFPGVGPEEIADGTQFAADLEADSLDGIELVMNAEDEFGVSISDEDAERLTTFGAAVKHLADRLEIGE